MATPAVSAIQRESGEGWRVVLAAYFGVMVSFGSLLVFSFSTFLKPLTAEFGWSREAVSAAFGFAALTVAVCSPVLGKLLDRFGPRAIILPCMAVFGIGFASLGLLTSHIWHLYAIFVLLGIVGNGTTQMGYSRAVSTWFTQRRGVALSLVMAGSATGAMIFPPLAQAFITSIGWRSAYFVLGAMVLVFGLPLTALFVRERGAAEQPGKPAQSGATVREGLRSRAFWLLIGSLFLGSVSVNGAITHLSPLLTDRGIGQQEAAFVASALGLFSFAGRLITGVLLDRFFGPRVGFCVFGVTAAGIVLLGSAGSMSSAVAAAALIGLGLGAEADITPYLLTRYFGLRAFSTLYGFSWTAYAIAGALGPVLMGRAFDVTGSYSSLLVLLSISTVLSAALYLGLPKYPAKQEMH
ncbi:MAG TPA: MFS transporter [Bryobacteraceae bacterium]|nr:MFS transporter [Bryobacteraceae bacterium]